MSKGSFAKAAGIMVAAIFVSRILGLVRESVVAAHFGQGALTDAYNSAITLPDLLYFMIAGGALSSAFIPVFTDYLTTGRDEDAWKVYSVIASLMAMVIGAFVVLGMVAARWVVPFFSPTTFTPAELDLTANLTRILLPAQLFFFIGGLTMGTLYSRNHFFVPSLGPIIYNLGIIFGAAWLAKFLGISGLAWGAVFGAFLGNFLLQVIYSARLGIRFKFSLDIRHPGVRQVFLLMLPVLLGLSLPQVDVIINRWFARFLTEGSMSALNYANRLMQVPLGIFGQAAGIAALPTLSALVAQKDWKQYKDTLSFGVRSVFFATIPSAAFMIVLAKPMITLILQAGRFSAVDTQYAATALVYYSIGVFAWGGQAIVARGFYALQDTATPIIIGTIMTLIFIPLNWLLMKPLGHGGLALATSIMAIAHMLALSQVLAKRVDGIGGWRILHSTARITAASVMAAAAAWGISNIAAREIALKGTAGVKMTAALQLLPALAVGTVVYLIFCKAFKVEEAAAFAGMIRSRLRKNHSTQV